MHTCAFTKGERNMTDEELLNKIQANADETAKKFIRPARMSLIYREPTAEGGEKVLVLGSDMPLLVYRLFDVDKDGNITENGNIQAAVEATKHYNVDIKPSLKLVPPEVEESNEYAIEVENKLDNGGVEVKLKSTTGRDVTMSIVITTMSRRSSSFPASERVSVGNIFSLSLRIPNISSSSLEMTRLFVAVSI